VETKITALKINRRRKNLVDVYLDGTKKIQLGKSVAYDLQIGQTLSADQIEELKERHLEQQLFLKAVDLVSRRPRSEGEIRVRFTKMKANSEIQEKVIVRLREARMLDDLAFANAWVENRLTFRPRSAWALSFELRKKGVSQELIEQVLEGFNEENAAYKAALIGSRKFRNLSNNNFRKRLGAYLKRRGFRYHIISPVLDRVWQETIGFEEKGEGLL
jgi:regulatory protein